MQLGLPRADDHVGLLEPKLDRTHCPARGNLGSVSRMSLSWTCLYNCCEFAQELNLLFFSLTATHGVLHVLARLLSVALQRVSLISVASWGQASVAQVFHLPVWLWQSCINQFDTSPL